MAIKKVIVEVSAKGLTETTSAAKKLNSELDRAEKPRKVRAASAALSASAPAEPKQPTNTGLTRGTAAAKGRGDARDFGREAQGLGGLVHLYATFAANVFAVSAAFTALSKAADFTNMEKAAGVLSTKVGVSIRGLAKDMQLLTDGAISMSDALSATSLAASAGLTSKQIKELTTVAKGASIALGRDMTDALQRVFRGTIKIEPELLDELGLMVKVDDANKEYAKSLNKTISALTDYERRQAFVNAVTVQGIDKYKELTDQAANPFTKLLSSIKDVGTTILNTINTALGPLVSLLSNSPTGLLLGMGALVALLLKQAVPAISNMQEAWRASDNAARETLQKQQGVLEARKQQIIDTDKDRADKALISFTKSRDALLKSLKGSGLSSYKEVRESTALSNFMGLSEEQIKSQVGKINKLLDTAKEKIQKKLNSALTELKAPEISSEDYDKVLKKIEKAQSLEQRRTDFSSGINTISAAATARAVSEKTLINTDKEIKDLTNKIGKFEKMGDRLSAIRSAVQATETGGLRLGIAELFDNIAKGVQVTDGVTKEFSILDKVLIGVKGTFQVVTVAISRLLSSFTIWMAVFTIMIPLVMSMLKWTGLLSGKLDELATSTDKANESTALFVSIQEKLAKGNNLADTYELQAAAAQSLADSIRNLIEQQEKLDNIRNKGTFLDKQGAGYQKMFGLGTFDKESELNTVKVYEDMVKKGLIEKGTVKVKTRINHKYGKRENDLNSKTYEDASSIYEQSDAAERARKAIENTDPKLLKMFDEYNITNKATTKNLQELTDLSSEYSRNLVNQSKELKALNTLSSSATGTLKQLNNRFSGGAADIANFLNGITTEFEDMSNSKLPIELIALRDALNTVDAGAASYRNTLLAEGKARGESGQELKDKVEGQVAARLKEGRDYYINKYGEANIQSDLSKYTVKAADSLAKFSLAASNAAVAQAKVANDLKKLNLFSSLSEGNSNVTLASAEYSAEDKRAGIEQSTIRTRKSNLETQLTRQQIVLSELIDRIERQTNFKVGGRSKVEADKLIGASKGIPQIAPFLSELVSASTAVTKLEAELKTLSNEVAVINLGTTNPASSDFDLLTKAIEKYTNNALKDNTLEATNRSLDIDKKYAIPDSLGVVGSNEIKSYDNALSTIKEQQDSLLIEIENSNLKLSLLKHYLFLERNKGKKADERVIAIFEEGIENTDKKKNLQLSSQNTKLQELETIKLTEQNRKRDVALTQLSNNNNLLTTQIALYRQISDITLETSSNYSRTQEINRLQVDSLNEQLKLEDNILENTLRIEKAKLAAAKLIGNSQGQIEAEQAILKVRQQYLGTQLALTKQILDLEKEQHDIKLKKMEEQGTSFSKEGFKEAGMIMANRLEETLNKTTSALSQLATGLVDAADTIVDSFTTMIQKMDEVEIRWIDFRDMVRNVLSDMFRDVASDILKNQVKKMMKETLKYFDIDMRSDPEKLADRLNKTTEENINALKDNTIEINRLYSALSLKLNPTKAQEYSKNSMGITAEEASSTASASSAATKAQEYSKNSMGITAEEASSASSVDTKATGVNTPTIPSFETNQQDYIKEQADLDKVISNEYSKTSKTIKSSGEGFMSAADKIGISATVMQGAVGGLVGALIGGGSPKAAIGGILAGVATSIITGGITKGLGVGFANGGIMSKLGEIPLHKYAKGGIANSPQLAMFGEGSKNEAYVPLPDNRSIPVTLKGSQGTSMGDVNISIEINNSGDSSPTVSIDQSKQLGNSISIAVKNAVQEELLKQMKPNGMLYSR